MKKIRFYFFFITKFINRYKFKLSLILACILLILFIFLRLKVYLDIKVVSEGIIGTYTEEDLPPIVTNLTSRGLVTINEENKPVPEIAESWTASEDVKTYIFKIKKDLQWADKTALKASDLSFQIPDVTVNLLDEYTIEFKLADSLSPFPTLLTKPLFKKNTHIGTGPYLISKVEKDKNFVKKISLKPLDQRSLNITIRFYPNEKIAKTALRLGEVQSLLGLADTGSVLSDKTFKLYSKTNFSRIVTIFYNTADPILSDENFRLGLSYAAPSIPNEIEAKTSLSINSWAFNPAVKDFLDNPEQAKIYLDKVKNGRDSTITLTATSSLKDVGEKVVAAWGKAGVKAVLRTESGVPQDFQALLITQNIPDDPDQYALWHKLGSINISKYHHDRIDKDLEDGRKTIDAKQRKNLYFDFQKSLLDHAPAAFLYFPSFKTVYLRKIDEDINKLLEVQLSNI